MAKVRVVSIPSTCRKLPLQIWLENMYMRKVKKFATVISNPKKTEPSLKKRSIRPFEQNVNKRVEQVLGIETTLLKCSSY
jgi:hypothetical protein